MVPEAAVGQHLGVKTLVALALAWTLPAVAQSHWVVVNGLGGEAQYARMFTDYAATVQRAADSAAETVTVLEGDGANGESIRQAVATAADGALVLVLIGHGTYDDEHYRFNVPGPDPTAEDLATWLAASSASPQLVVLATSASGAALPALRREGRSLIAATKDGYERNAVVFSRFWAEAVRSTAADTDKDRRIDGEEAFRFAENAIEAHYEREGRIATEHPKSEGDLARFTMAVLDPGRTPDGRRQALLEQIAALRASRAAYTEDGYFSHLQELLLELAAVERELESP